MNWVLHLVPTQRPKSFETSFFLLLLRKENVPLPPPSPFLKPHWLKCVCVCVYRGFVLLLKVSSSSCFWGPEASCWEKGLGHKTPTHSIQTKVKQQQLLLLLLFLRFYGHFPTSFHAPHSQRENRVGLDVQYFRSRRFTNLFIYFNDVLLLFFYCHYSTLLLLCCTIMMISFPPFGFLVVTACWAQTPGWLQTEEKRERGKQHFSSLTNNNKVSRCSSTFLIASWASEWVMQYTSTNPFHSILALLRAFALQMSFRVVDFVRREGRTIGDTLDTRYIFFFLFLCTTVCAAASSWWRRPFCSTTTKGDERSDTFCSRASPRLLGTRSFIKTQGDMPLSLFPLPMYCTFKNVECIQSPAYMYT